MLIIFKKMTKKALLSVSHVDFALTSTFMNPTFSWLVQKKVKSTNALAPTQVSIKKPTQAIC